MQTVTTETTQVNLWAAMTPQEQDAERALPKAERSYRGFLRAQLPDEAAIAAWRAKRPIRSKRGSWGVEISGGRVAALTAAECRDRGLEPGPAND